MRRAVEHRSNERYRLQALTGHVELGNCYSFKVGSGILDINLRPSLVVCHWRGKDPS